MERADVVFPPEPEARPDNDRLLADAGIDAAAHLALADEDTETLVEGADQPHPVEHVEELLGRELELRPFDRGHRSINQSGNRVIW